MKIGNTTTRIVVWTLTGSILTTSCTNGNMYALEEMESSVNEKDLNKQLHVIHIQLTKEQQIYLSKLFNLSDKIVKDRKFAKNFLANPKLYFHDIQTRAGIKMETPNDLSTDASLQNIVKALADDDIAKAIEQNDIKQYLSLMYEKGYLDETAKINDYYNLLSTEDKKAILESLGLDTNESALISVGAVVAVFYMAVIAVSWVGVAYTVAGVVNAAVGATVVAYIGAVVKTKVKTSGLSNKVNLSSNFDVYLLTASEKNKRILFSDENINTTVKDVVQAYSDIFIKDATKANVEDLEKFVNLNLSKLPEFSSKSYTLE
ncbi:hypothetical protein [Prevotella falsenii]